MCNIHVNLNCLAKLFSKIYLLKCLFDFCVRIRLNYLPHLLSPGNSFDDRPTRERCFISSRPIRVDELKEVCDRLHANKDAGFIQEFKVSKFCL